MDQYEDVTYVNCWNCGKKEIRLEWFKRCPECNARLSTKEVE